MPKSISHAQIACMPNEDDLLHSQTPRHRQPHHQASPHDAP
jgi:hypothetical protein